VIAATSGLMLSLILQVLEAFSLAQHGTTLVFPHLFDQKYLVVVHLGFPGSHGLGIQLLEPPAIPFSVPSEAPSRAVQSRADGRCQYCLVHESLQRASFAEISLSFRVSDRQSC